MSWLSYIATFLQIFNATEEMKDAVNYPHIRVFIAAEKESTKPLDDLAEGGIFQPWSLPGKKKCIDKRELSKLNNWQKRDKDLLPPVGTWTLL